MATPGIIRRARDFTHTVPFVMAIVAGISNGEAARILLGARKEAS